MGYKCTFPILYQEMKDQKRLKKQEFDTKSIDWKGETKKNYLYLAAFSKIIDGMSKDKEKGNEHLETCLSRILRIRVFQSKFVACVRIGRRKVCEWFQLVAFHE